MEREAGGSSGKRRRRKGKRGNGGKEGATATAATTETPADDGVKLPNDRLVMTTFSTESPNPMDFLVLPIFAPPVLQLIGSYMNSGSRCMGCTAHLSDPACCVMVYFRMKGPYPSVVSIPWCGSAGCTNMIGRVVGRQDDDRRPERWELVMPCYGCNRPTQVRDLLTCPGCTVARYCDADCQRTDLRRHKPWCLKLGKAIKRNALLRSS